MVSPSDSLSETESCNDQDIWDGHDDDANFDGLTQRRRARKKRKRNNSGPTTRTTPGSSSISTLTLQPLIDVLVSRYASADSEDVNFDSIAKSVLEQCVKTRDELGELHERDDLGRPYLLISPSDEADLLEMLEARSRNGLSVAEAIILRKLKLQRHMRTHNLSPPVLRPKTPSALTGLAPACKPPEPDPEVLKALYDVQTIPYKSSFLSRLNGFSVRRAPVVAADWEARPPWMDLMEDIRAHYALKFLGMEVVQESLAPITYVTLTAEHLPQVHDLLHRSFWSGIDVSDSLRHMPEQATIVAMYKRLLVGCAILSSPAETYITYLAVRAGWENAQIATAMLFHLISRNPNKDITLHVSANNPAMLLYNRFGFKAEEFVVDFYRDYLDPQSRMSKNAFRLRLRR
ncbi:hypothetical protein EDB86DRAFT_1037800 [Lactarius hatsudake]|nr:hypothetical protein EDB86DRAFT_1037800 [Lactarius hatsudake]